MGVRRGARLTPRPVWATYKQWAQLNAQVRKGEKSSLVVFYKEFDVGPTDETDDGKRRVARASWVFNADQIDGYAAPQAPQPLGPIDRIAAADRFVTATGAKIEHAGERAFYRPSTDHIQIAGRRPSAARRACRAAKVITPLLFTS